MATKTIFVLLFTFQCFLRSQTSTNMLDFTELHDVNYGIDIAANPVVLGEEALSTNMYLTSIYGQQYQCSIPDPIGDEEKAKEEEKVAMETGIIELLKPMTEAVCLVHTKDWWTYELCYGKYIKQYHKEDGKISGAVTMLGHFQSDFDWTNETMEKSRNRLGRYHSQEYTNGTICDLTGKARQAQVRFLCEVGHGDYISRIEEPSTCVYNIIVHTPKLCTHPYLKARAPKRPVQITCNPILSADEYQEYQEYQEEQEREAEAFRAYQKQLQAEREEELLAQQKKAEEERLAKLEAEQAVRVAEAEDDDGFVSDEDSDELVDYEQEVDLAVSILQNLFSESLAEGLQDIFEKEGYLDKITPPNIDAKAYKETKHSKNGATSESKDNTLKFESQNKRHNIKKRLSGEQIKEKFPSIVLQNRVVYVETDVNGRRRWTLETDLEANEDAEIIEWAELEVEEGFQEDEMMDLDEDSEEDIDKLDDELMEEYEKELEAIKAGHKSTKGSLAKYKETIESALKAKFPDIVEEAEQELGLDPSEVITREEAFTAMAKTLTKLLKKLDDPDPDPGEDEDAIDTEEDEHLETHPQASSESGAKKDLPDDDRVRVRLTRVAQVEGEEEETEPAKLPGEIQIPEEQKAKLETQMKAELEKAGMDTEGRKIEVKIITAGYIDGDDTLHILSDDESTAFNNMIVTILQGSTEADKEAKHQNAMEDNYKFQWGDNKKSKKPVL